MGTRILLALASLFVVAPAMAGTVYRCVGQDGIPNYSSKRLDNAVCNAVAHSSDRGRISAFSRAPSVAAATAPDSSAQSLSFEGIAPVASARKVSFRSAPGGTTLLPASSGGGRVIRGAIYRYERDGVVHYTNVRPAGGARTILFSYVETCYACGVLRGVNFRSVQLNTQAYSNEIHTAAQQYGVEEAVVRAIIHAESAYRPNAMSHAGAQGLMQLIPATASRFGVADAFDPGQNIRGGVQYLAWLMKRYSSNLTLVAAAYNAGEGAVDRNGGVPPYSETQRYVQRVGQLADRYRSELAGR